MATKVSRAEIQAFKEAFPVKYAEMMERVKHEVENGVDTSDSEPREVHKCNSCRNDPGCTVSCECKTRILNGRSGNRWMSKVEEN